MTIYSKFVKRDKLISPKNGYECRRITKQNISNFGFNSIDDLQEEYPDFPLMCKEYKDTRPNGIKSQKFKEHIIKENQKNESEIRFRVEKYNRSPKTCPKCKNSITYDKRKNKFCSRSCANSRTHSKETKEKISKSVINNPTGFVLWDYDKKYENVHKRKKPRKNVKCKTCLNVFEVIESSKRVYCCGKCNPNLGGYRKGSGRAYGGYYKGIYCHSTYELVWVMFNISHNIPFKKFPGYIFYKHENKQRKYFPDFIQNNTIIEIKGYHTELVDIKKNAAIEQGYDIKVLYKDDLSHCFEWFEKTFPDKKLNEMFGRAYG